MKINTNPIRGTRDFLPQEVELRDYVKNTIIEVYQNHGFTKIETPILENIDLLLGSDGGENLKMLFKVLKRGEKLNLNQENLKELDIVDMGLRYDLTLPLSRFYANNVANLPTTFKSIQVGKVYRAERPQKGRFRSFVQCDIDIIGEESYIAELELILTTSKALLKLDFNDFTVKINDRRILKAIIEYAGFSCDDINDVCISLDKLDKIGVEGVKNELFKKGYKEENVEGFIKILRELEKSNLEDLSKLSIDEEVVLSLKNTIDIVSKQSDGKYKIVFTPSLVRGMGYYTGMIFEIEYGDFGSSIAGGGRYNKMIGRFMKNDIPAVGFSIGFERIINILQEKNFEIPNRNKSIVFLYDKYKDDIEDVLDKAEVIRNNNKSVTILPKEKKLGKQLNRLKTQGFDYFCIYGEGLEIKDL